MYSRIRKDVMAVFANHGAGVAIGEKAETGDDMVM